jgi:O-antigen ligase/Tfp pilus assembly protein PilF
LISLPENRAEYRQDPERILKLAGVAAPPGSAERMVFENRLFDGGPTGTFALANSLAAVLLVSVIGAVGVLRFHWRQLQPVQRISWAAAGVLCAACLMAARSRSATLAGLIGMALIFVASSRLRSRNRKTLVLGLAGVSLLGLGGVLFIALAGNREWFEEAPASLAVRLQYWRSTWQLVLDRPLFGAGPGNFQSIYERYREATTTEQVAEPHNLFFETLASGGFVGLGLLLLAIAASLIAITSRAGDADVDQPEDDSDRWLWLGAILSLVMIWLIGWASRHLPDLDASLFVLPTALIAAVVLAPSVRSLPAHDLDSIVGVALIAILIHLMVAGGWTVPGVAIIIWIFAAMLTRRDNTWASHPWVNSTANDSSSAKQSDRDHSKDQTSSTAPVKLALAICCNFLILAALYLVSLRPVENQKQLLATAAMAQSSGQLGKARLSLEQASRADRWSPDAMLWLADFYCWKLVLEGDTREVRRQWESCLAEVKRRAGDDPAVYRMIGAQQLHAYQRHGEPRDLGAAAETFEKAVQWSPVNQWMMAQMAVVAEALGQRDQAQKLGKRAAELAELGGNIERALSRQQVYVPRPLGRLADRGPLRQPADKLLSGLNSTD